MKQTPPTANERELRKSDNERAEDVAYTINHALACTLTDFIDPYVGNLTQQFLGKRFSIGCGSHHHEAPSAHGPACDHHHHHHEHKHAWIAEAAGDFGAVPVTIAFQRLAPGFMEGLGKLTEPVLGPLFRIGARRSAQAWAWQQGLGAQSAGCREKEEQIYRHEISHLPQAALWTASSIAINIGTQKLTGNTAPLAHIAAGKAVGAGISTALVVGARAIAPQTARSWDRFTSQKLFLPPTKAVGKLFGVQPEDVDRMIEKQKELDMGYAAKEKNRQARTKPAAETPARPGRA